MMMKMVLFDLDKMKSNFLFFDLTICSLWMHIPDDSVSLYRLYVRLAKKSFPADSTLMELAEKVASLNEINMKPKTK